MKGRMAPDILCIGAVLWDIIARSPVLMAKGDDVPGRIDRVPGGVAMNIAATLVRLGWHPGMLCAIGHDAEGAELIARITGMGLDAAHVFRCETPTDRYLAIEDSAGLVGAVADAHSLELAGAAILTPLSDGRLGSRDAPWPGPVALDGNLTTALLAEIAASPLFAKADLRIAPASPGKADRLTPLLRHPGATLYLNLFEANVLSGHPDLTAPAAARRLLDRGAERVLVTDGPRLCADAAHARGVIEALPPAVALRRVTGAGDTFMAAHLTAELHGLPRAAALDAALTAAARFISGD